jgi:hypothetical protein
MATKNLARTVVEGGRAGYSKLDRKLRNRRERRLRFDLEGELCHGRPSGGGYRGFADCLSPLERWVGSHVGRGWSRVYHEFCQRFDERTMKGWHLRDHLLGMVGLGRFGWHGTFFVDVRGILRRRPRRRREPRLAAVGGEMQALTWAAGRRVIVHGEAAFWTADPVSEISPASAQGRRLTAGEMEVWSTLAPPLREKLLYDHGLALRRRR